MPGVARATSQTAYTPNMQTIRVSSRSLTAAVGSLARAAAYLSTEVSQSSEQRDEYQAKHPERNAADKVAFRWLMKNATALQVQAKALDEEKTVRVYRKHQPTTDSPCKLAPLTGPPCATCAAHGRCGFDPCHSCRRGRYPNCERATAAAPAFRVPISAAIKAVKEGLAKFIDMRRAIRLELDTIPGLRGRSLSIDAAFLAAFADGAPWALAIARNWEWSSHPWGKRRSPTFIAALPTFTY